jgi:anti-anti-sigma factor
VAILEHVYRDLVILEPTERLTVETEADLKDAVRHQLDAGRVHLVLDLGRVPYIDSCGLGRVLQAHVSARRLGGELKLLNVNGRNRQLLTITRLLTVLEPYQPETSAAGA